MNDNKKKGINGWYILLIIVVGGFINFLMSYDPSVLDKYDNKKDFDWNSEKDVGDFLKWKEKNGTGWSDN